MLNLIEDIWSQNTLRCRIFLYLGFVKALHFRRTCKETSKFSTENISLVFNESCLKVDPVKEAVSGVTSMFAQKLFKFPFLRCFHDCLCTRTHTSEGCAAFKLLAHYSIRTHQFGIIKRMWEDPEHYLGSYPDTAHDAINGIFMHESMADTIADIIDEMLKSPLSENITYFIEIMRDTYTKMAKTPRPYESYKRYMSHIFLTENFAIFDDVFSTRLLPDDIIDMIRKQRHDFPYLIEFGWGVLSCSLNASVLTFARLFNLICLSCDKNNIAAVKPRMIHFIERYAQWMMEHRIRFDFNVLLSITRYIKHSPISLPGCTLILEKHGIEQHV
jgi:hypothetical protein